MSGFRGTTSPGCEANMPGNNFNVKSRKKTSKTGTDAKVTESSYVDCWQKWLKKKIKCAVLAVEPRHFWPGRLISIICLCYFRDTAGPKIEILMTRLMPSLVLVACGRVMVSPKNAQQKNLKKCEVVKKFCVPFSLPCPCPPWTCSARAAEGKGWFIQRFMSSLMAVFSQTAGSKKGLFSILVSRVLAWQRPTVLAWRIFATWSTS